MFKNLFRLRRWRLVAAAAVGVFAILAAGTQSFAAQPNESNFWTHQTAGGAWVQTPGVMHEARNANGYGMRVWRGQGDNQVWFSSGENGNAYTVRTTNTIASPTIVRFGNGFMVVHVGTDHLIYYSLSVTNTPVSSLHWTQWRSVPNQFTAMTPALAQLGDGTFNRVQMVLRGDNNDNRIYSASYDGNSWSSQGPIGQATSNSSPSIVWRTAPGNTYPGITTVFYRGLNDIVYITNQIDTRLWTAPQALNSPNVGYAASEPAASWDSVNRRTVLAIQDSQARMWSLIFPDNSSAGAWQQESTNVATPRPPTLSSSGGSTFIDQVDYNRYVFWKRLG